MNYAGIISEDIADSVDGLCVSLWFNGCDIRCPGCHNAQYWDVVNEVDNDQIALHLIEELEDSLGRGLVKSLSILGGEPLTKNNRGDCLSILDKIRNSKVRSTYIRMWTGRTKEQLLKESEEDYRIPQILSYVDELIVGPYIESLKEQLPLRGSSNQEILKNGPDYVINRGKLIYNSHIKLEDVNVNS